MSANVWPPCSTRWRNSGGLFDVETKLSALARIEAKMGQPNFWNEPEAAQRQMQELKRLKAVVEPMTRLQRRSDDLAELHALAAEEKDADTLAEVERELAAAEQDTEHFAFKAMLSGEYDQADAFLTVQAGAGGTEACDWAGMLLRMYSRWAERHGYATDLIDAQEGDEAGYRSVTLEVHGPYAYGYLKSEIGVHRLVRISPFDAAARRHTSFASVDVAPMLEADEVDIELDEKEIRVDRFRAGGPGGQHVNVTDSAVRVTHLATGIVAQCQNERSQHQNLAVAMKMLKARLYARRQEEREAEMAALSGVKPDIAWGNQRRNYVLQPYTLAKDLVADIERGDVHNVLDGDLDPFIEGTLRKRIGKAAAGRTGSGK
jgi:peptide chain release factor 2